MKQQISSKKINPSLSLNEFRYKFLDGTLTIKDVMQAEPKLTRAQAVKQLALLRSMRPKKTDWIGQKEDEPKGRYRGTPKKNPKLSIAQAKQILRSRLAKFNALKAQARSALAEAGYTAKGIYDLESGYVAKVNNPIAKITKAYIRHYADSGQTTAYVEWVDEKGKTGRTEGKPSGLHMEALLNRARREGVAVEKQTWNGVTKRNATASDFKRVQSNKLISLAKMFQGHANGEKRRVLESDYTPKEKYRLGHLVQIKIKDAGKVIPINFDGESYLAGDLKNNLWIVGKDSRIVNIKLPPKGQLKYLGELVQFDYITAKSHIEQGKTVRYYHKPGEVTGEKPNVFVDDEGFVLIIGGGFDIWSVGVVN